MRALLTLLSLCLTVSTRAQSTADLEALDPAKPLAYFELAELFAQSAPSNTDARDHAIRLYVLAYEIARERAPTDAASTSRPPSPTGLGSPFSVRASACLGLAALEPSDERRQWLRALAERLDARYATPLWTTPPTSTDEKQARLQIAEAVGHVLAGRARTALDILEQPRVERVAKQLAPALDSKESPASYPRLLQLAEAFRSPPCGGARFVVENRGNLRTQTLCPDNDGNPGPNLSLTERIDYLRFEALVLDASPRSWVGELATGVPAPLLDPDPAELAPTYNVDPSRRVYRDGEWTTVDTGNEKPDA